MGLSLVGRVVLLLLLGLIFVLVGGFALVVGLAFLLNEVVGTGYLFAICKEPSAVCGVDKAIIHQLAEFVFLFLLLAQFDSIVLLNLFLSVLDLLLAAVFLVQVFNIEFLAGNLVSVFGIYVMSFGDFSVIIDTIDYLAIWKIMLGTVTPVLKSVELVDRNSSPSLFVSLLHSGSIISFLLDFLWESMLGFINIFLSIFSFLHAFNITVNIRRRGFFGLACRFVLRIQINTTDNLIVRLVNFHTFLVNEAIRPQSVFFFLLFSGFVLSLLPGSVLRSLLGSGNFCVVGCILVHCCSLFSVGGDSLVWFLLGLGLCLSVGMMLLVVFVTMGGVALLFMEV